MLLPQTHIVCLNTLLHTFKSTKHAHRAAASCYGDNTQHNTANSNHNTMKNTAINATGFTE